MTFVSVDTFLFHARPFIVPFEMGEGSFHLSLLSSSGGLAVVVPRTRTNNFLAGDEFRSVIPHVHLTIRPQGSLR